MKQYDGWLGAVRSRSTGQITHYAAVAQDNGEANFHVYKEHCAQEGVEHKPNLDWETGVLRIGPIDSDGERARAWRLTPQQAQEVLAAVRRR
jgi:hypothetical protein